MSDGPEKKSPPPRTDDMFTRVLDSLVDLLETARDWIRQEAEAAVKEKVVYPLQRLGITLASAIAAAVLLVIGLIFIAVSAVIALGNAIGYAWTFFLIGAVYLIGSAVFLYIKVRSIQK
ncbi:MAG TPA: phage holin family protein [Coriobacteriia bacterium]